MSAPDTEKLNALREHILDKARFQSDQIVAQARGEVTAWLKEERHRLDWEAEMILRDAKQRAEEVKRRELAAAEREKGRERLREQNRLLQEAFRMLHEEFVALRSRPEYAGILLGLAREAAGRLGDVASMRVRLAMQDAPIGETLCDDLRRELPGRTVTFDAEPAPISGGVWILSEDGRRQASADWRTKVGELSETLAERLLAQI